MTQGEIPESFRDFMSSRQPRAERGRVFSCSTASFRRPLRCRGIGFRQRRNEHNLRRSCNPVVHWRSNAFLDAHLVLARGTLRCLIMNRSCIQMHRKACKSVFTVSSGDHWSRAAIRLIHLSVVVL